MIARDDFAKSRPVQRWLDAMSLVDGFALFVLVSPAPLETRLCVEALRMRMAWTVDDVRVLDPYAGPSTVGPALLFPSVLLDRIIAPLVRPGVSGAKTVVVDLSNLSFFEPQANRATWEWCLGRLNEQRNTLVHANARSVVLVVDDLMEQLVVQAAPDLWSIRSDVYVLPSVARPDREAWLPSVHAVIRQLCDEVDAFGTSPSALATFRHLATRAADADADAVARGLADASLAELDQPVLAALFELLFLLAEANRSGWSSVDARFGSLAGRWLSSARGVSDSVDGVAENAARILWSAGLVAAASGSPSWAQRCLNDAMDRFRWAISSGTSSLSSLYPRGLTTARANLWVGDVFAARHWCTWVCAMAAQDWVSVNPSGVVEMHPPERFRAAADLCLMLGDVRRAAWLMEQVDSE